MIIMPGKFQRNWYRHVGCRERGRVWGSRPPYGYQRAEENSKKLVPEPEEAEIIRQIFYWYVFEEMSSYDIARELNGRKVLGPEDSYQKRKQGKVSEKRRLWGIQTVSGRFYRTPFI